MKHILLLMAAAAGVLGLGGCGQPPSQALFNGSNLDGWTTYLKDPSVDPAAVWSIRDGVIRCKGQPQGYLRTTQDYADYRLQLEWRWVDQPTNSGVLLHTTGDDKIWPMSVEAQLMHEHAGDFVTIQNGSAITVNGRRHQPTDAFYHIVPRQHACSEKPAGQWNRYDIVCRGKTITLTVNGILQNSATDSALTRGAICLQSEGSPIEFRNILLTPLTQDTGL